MRNTIKDVYELYPGYFALVMATGIVSIAAYLLEIDLVAWLLFQINKVAYGVLWLLTLARLIQHFHRPTADLIDHTRGRASLRWWPERVCWGVNLLSRRAILEDK